MKNISPSHFAVSRLTGCSVQLHTFGSPRVGNAGFVQAFATLSGEGFIVPNFRNVHERDIVAHLPPELLNFRHVRQEIWNHKDQFVSCDLSGEDPNCSDSDWYFTVADHLLYLGETAGLCGSVPSDPTSPPPTEIPTNTPTPSATPSATPTSVPGDVRTSPSGADDAPSPRAQAEYRAVMDFMNRLRLHS
jgi:hypothetical protein